MTAIGLQGKPRQGQGTSAILTAQLSSLETRIPYARSRVRSQSNYGPRTWGYSQEPACATGRTRQAERQNRCERRSIGFQKCYGMSRLQVTTEILPSMQLLFLGRWKLASPRWPPALTVNRCRYLRGARVEAVLFGQAVYDCLAAEEDFMATIYCTILTIHWLLRGPSILLRFVQCNRQQSGNTRYGTYTSQ